MIVGVVFVVGRSTPTTSPNTGIHGRAGAETEKIKSTLRRHMADSRQAVILERAVSLLNYLYMFQSPDSVQHARANAQMLPQRERGRERSLKTACHFGKRCLRSESNWVCSQRGGCRPRLQTPALRRLQLQCLKLPCFF